MAKKMMLLAGLALAAVAFSIPAAASADVWTDNDVALGAGKVAKQSFEGFLKFNAGGGNTFECEVTVEIEAVGVSTGNIKKVNPTTTTCKGTGVFAPPCPVSFDSTNALSTGWNLNVATTPLKLTSDGNLEFNFQFTGCFVVIFNAEFASGSITVTPTQSSNTITKLSVAGTSTQGILLSGSLVPESALTLGIK